MPNAITVSRVGLLVVFLGALGLEPEVFPPRRPVGWTAWLALLGIGGSDLLDGYLARRFGLTSRVGVVLDAVADKTCQIGIAAYFTFLTDLFPTWFFALLVSRDVLMGLGTYAVARLAPGAPLRHRAHGKAASAVMFVLFVWTLSGSFETVRRGFIVAVAGLVIVSTALYVAEGRAMVRSRRP